VYQRVRDCASAVQYPQKTMSTQAFGPNERNKNIVTVCNGFITHDVHTRARARENEKKQCFGQDNRKHSAATLRKGAALRSVGCGYKVQQRFLVSYLMDLYHQSTALISRAASTEVSSSYTRMIAGCIASSHHHTQVIVGTPHIGNRLQTP
jgi:hypothetical protein